MEILIDFLFYMNSLAFVRSVSQIYLLVMPPLLLLLQFYELGSQATTNELIPSSFQTTVQVNLLNERSSVLLRYHYDEKKGRRSIRITENKKEEIILIDNRKETVYFMSKSKINCEESDLSLANLELWQRLLFGENPLMKLVNISSKPFKFNSEAGTKSFKASGTSRSGKLLATFDAVLDIRESDWLTVTGWKNVPVRIAVKGNTSINQQLSPFLYQYEFLNFTGHIPDISVFNIPEGMMCEDFHSVEDFPKIGKSFHVKIEKIQPALNKLLPEEWWFQSDLVVARHDYKP